MLSLAALAALPLLLMVGVRFAAERRRGPHPFTVHDLLALDRLSDVRVSPDGRRIAFVVRVTDLERNRGRTQVWILDRDRQRPRQDTGRTPAPPVQLTTHDAGASHPRWSPDGQWIYFLSSRNDSSQVWRIRVDGGEAEAVTDLPLDVGSFALSPTGTHLAVSLEVFPKTRTLVETKKRLDEIKQRKASGRVYDRLLVRHWDTWKDGRRSHLFVLPIDAAPRAADGQGGETPAKSAHSRQPTGGGAAPVDVMKGMDADCPSKPFGGAEEYTFTPDGQALVFACRNVGRKEAWSTHFNLYRVPIDGKKRPEMLVDGRGAVVTQPRFAPDGRSLAWLAMERPGYEADRLRIVVRPWPEGEPRVLTEDWDRSPGSIAWAADGKTIFTAADDLGEHPLFAVGVADGRVAKLLKSGRVSDIAVAGDEIVFGLCHLQSPVELHALPAGGGRCRPLTSMNARKLAAVKMGATEPFTFKGWNNDDVYVYVVKPVDFSAKKKVPVAFLIHGGPQGSFGNNFHYRWNPQVYAGAGYAVVMVDFHGSTGYGQEFTDAINGHWGDRPLEDLQKGLAAALQRYAWMDGNRIAALGASYGGYMVNWLHGVWNEPFKCLVCHDGNLDERMAYFDTEELWFPEWERGGTPWEKPHAYAEHNPIDHVANWRLPTLVIHGQRDFRVVDTQGLSVFTALQRRGVPSRLLHFPDENHWVLKPHNSIQWHEEVLGWLERWCRK